MPKLIDMAELAVSDNDRAARIRAGRGSLAHLATGQSIVDELIAERRAEGETDQIPEDRLRAHR